MTTTPWDGKPVTIVFADQRTMLSIATTKPGDNPNMVFETRGANAQLEDLYATLAASKLPIRAANIVLYGTKLGDNGKPLPVVAAQQSEYTANDGTTRKANYAFSSKQLDEFVPLSFIIKTKWMKKKGGGTFPAPLFMVYSTPFERTRVEQEMGFQRVTSAVVNEPPKIARAVRASKA